MEKLSTNALESYLKTMPNWTLDNNSLTQTIKRKNFRESVTFVLGVAELAEIANHHPDLIIKYDKVQVVLTTHDSQGITGKDIQLAQQIDVLISEKRPAS